MLKNYFKTAWRNITKNKVYSTINILGLATGMAVVMLIAFWIWDEVTYDRYFKNHDDIAQVMTTFIDNDGTKNTDRAVCMPIGNELRNKYGSDFKQVAMASWNFDHVLAVGENKIDKKECGLSLHFHPCFLLK